MEYTKNPAEQVYFTKLEAANYLRLSPRGIDCLLSRQELKAYRPGRKLLFRREDLDAFVLRHPAYAEVDRIIDETLADLREQSRKSGKAGRGDGQHAR